MPQQTLDYQPPPTVRDPSARRRSITPAVAFAASALLVNAIVVMKGTSEADGFAALGDAFILLPGANLVVVIVSLLLVGKVKRGLMGASLMPYLVSVFTVPVAAGLCAAKLILPGLWR